MNRKDSTRGGPTRHLLTACAIVAGLATALNYFVRLSNLGWQESKGYVQYYMEEQGMLPALGWIVGATLVAWIALVVRARSREAESSARKS